MVVRNKKKQKALRPKLAQEKHLNGNRSNQLSWWEVERLKAQETCKKLLQ